MCARSLIGKLGRVMSYRNEQHRLAAFEERMKVARDTAAHNPLGLLSLVRLIGRRLQADTIAQVVELAPHARRSSPDFDSLFFNSLIPITPDGKRFDDLVRQEDGPFYQLHLGRDLILPEPWHKDRISKALANIGSGKKCGPWAAERNHCVELYLPFGLVLVNGGNHSLTAGIVNGEGSVVNGYTLDMRPIYNYIRYDGISYVRIADGSEIKRHPDPDIGSIFEIGRILLEHGVAFDGTPAKKEDRDIQEERDERTTN